MNIIYSDDKIAIKLDHITKRFGNFEAVSDLSLNIYQGEILGFLGENGAGKSTTMKMIGRLLLPSAGNIWIHKNGDLQHLTSRNKDELLSNIGFLIETPTFYDNMTPREILSYFARLRNYPKEKIHHRVEEVVALMGMSKWIDQKTKKFSKGMRQKIGIVAAIVHDPAIAVLDEPHTGLDPSARAEVREFLLKLKAQKKTIFLSSHILYEISEIADRVAIISHGKLVACDTLDNLENIAKRSIIRMELFDFNPTNLPQTMEQLDRIIRPLIVSENKSEYLSYHPDTGIFEIMFDGNPLHQLQILRGLLAEQIPVLEFSVPKAGLLEDVYLKIINQSIDQTDYQIASNTSKFIDTQQSISNEVK